MKFLNLYAALSSQLNHEFFCVSIGIWDLPQSAIILYSHWVFGGIERYSNKCFLYRLQIEKLQHWRLKYGGSLNQAVN